MPQPEMQPDGDDREIHIDDPQGPGNDIPDSPPDMPDMTPDSQPEEVPDHQIDEK